MLQSFGEQADSLAVTPEDLEQIAKTHAIPHMKRYSRQSNIAGIRCSVGGFACVKVHAAGASTSFWSRTSQGDCANCRAGCATRRSVPEWIRARRASRSMRC